MTRRLPQTLTGPKPHTQEMARIVQQSLRVVRPEGYRQVKDPWGNLMKVSRDRVLEHIANHPHDKARWRFIPLIVPAIKQAQKYYEDGTRTRHEATLELKDGAGRTLFVRGIIEGDVAQPPDGRRRLAFDTIIAPTKDWAIRGERKRAGTLKHPRSNPIELTYIGTLDPRQQDRAAQRLQGAAPALNKHNRAESRRLSRAVRLGLVLGGIWLLSQAQRQIQEAA